MSNANDTAPAFQAPPEYVKQMLEQFGDWTECVAFRVVEIDGGVMLEVTNDLDAITSPGAE